MLVYVVLSYMFCMVNVCGVLVVLMGMVIICSSFLTISFVCESRTSNVYVMCNVVGCWFVVFLMFCREILVFKFIGVFMVLFGIKLYRFLFTRIISRFFSCDRRRVRTVFVML